MAEAVQRRPGPYHAPGATYGNVAYDMGYAGSAARPLEREEEVLRPRPRTRERALTRPKVRVREAGKVSPFAVAGFLAVGVFAVLVLMSYVQLTVSADQVGQMNAQLSQLEAEHSRLLTKYELAYDLGAIEEQVTADGSMVKPDPSQIVTLDLTEPDSVVRYDGKDAAKDDGADFLSEAERILKGFVEYFR